MIGLALEGGSILGKKQMQLITLLTAFVAEYGSVYASVPGPHQHVMSRLRFAHTSISACCLATVPCTCPAAAAHVAFWGRGGPQRRPARHMHDSWQLQTHGGRRFDCRPVLHPDVRAGVAYGLSSGTLMQPRQDDKRDRQLTGYQCLSQS